MIIGLTGQIGAGKTSAARILADLGAAVIDADRVGREVVDQSAPLRRKLVRGFGPEIAGADGRIRRKRLAALAFRDESSRDTLNSLVHPYLLKELRRRLRQTRQRHNLVVIDAALLLHWGMDREVDYVLVIHAELDIRLKRLKARGIAREDGLARQRAQLGFLEFRRRSDRVILNNGSLNDLRRKVTALLREIMTQTDGT